MKFIETLASYIPSIIADELVEQLDPDGDTKGELKEAPYKISLNTVVMFCDVSGFTKLAEAMARSGMGAEGLAKYLNQYFSLMCKEIQAQGGDIFKFAGDAMIVLWPHDDEDPVSPAVAQRSSAHAFAREEGV